MNLLKWFRRKPKKPLPFQAPPRFVEFYNKYPERHAVLPRSYNPVVMPLQSLETRPYPQDPDDEYRASLDTAISLIQEIRELENSVQDTPSFGGGSAGGGGASDSWTPEAPSFDPPVADTSSDTGSCDASSGSSDSQ